MAYLADDPNNKMDQQSNAAGPATAGGQTGSSGSPLVGQSTPVSGGSSAPAAGTGGNSSWTNIQSYLNANQGDTGTSKLVSGIGDKIGQENQTLTKQASDATSQADAEADKTNISNDKASKLITEASQAGQGSDPYKQNTSQLKSAVTAQYGGPANFTYTQDPTNAQQGSALGNDQDFQNLLTSLYQKNAAGGMTTGQMNLQTQLDNSGTSRDAIEAARQAALGQYAGFTKNLNTLIPTTNSAVQADQARFGSQQQALQNYLNSSATTNRSGLQQLADQFNQGESAARTAQLAAPSDTDSMLFSNLNLNLGANNTGNNAVWQTVNKGDYTKYAPGDTAALNNIGGDMATTDRNQFNTIADILGQQQIAQAATMAKHGSTQFDASGYDTAWKNLISQMQGQGYNPMTMEMTPAQKAAYLQNQQAQGSGVAGQSGNDFMRTSNSSGGMI